MDSNVTRQILNQITTAIPGSVFVTRDFLDLGSRAAVDQVLSRLVRDGLLRRLGRGLFDNPRVHPKLGVLSPSAEAIVAALARKARSRVEVSGAKAANDLGLSLQVPARTVYLTDGASRSVTIGKQTIEFRHVSPQHLNGGPVIQALRYLGRNHVTDEVVSKLKHNLPPSGKEALRSAIPDAAAWMRPIIVQVTA